MKSESEQEKIPSQIDELSCGSGTQKSVSSESGVEIFKASKSELILSDDSLDGKQI
jgi:hypothetical protein